MGLNRRQNFIKRASNRTDSTNIGSGTAFTAPRGSRGVENRVQVRRSRQYLTFNWIFYPSIEIIFKVLEKLEANLYLILRQGKMHHSIGRKWYKVMAYLIDI